MESADFIIFTIVALTPDVAPIFFDLIIDQYKTLQLFQDNSLLITTHL